MDSTYEFFAAFFIDLEILAMDSGWEISGLLYDLNLEAIPPP